MSPLDHFFRDCIAALRRIVGAARGDLTLDDVKNEAWLLTTELEHKGLALDLNDESGRNSLIGRLYTRLVKPMRTQVGFALRLDKNWDDEAAGGVRLADVLSDPEAKDPLQQLESREAFSPLELACLESYSQATAYAVCLYHRPDESALATYLCITRDTLQDRVRRSRLVVTVQSSLFDRLERFPIDFCPVRGRMYFVLELPEIPVEQGAFCFSEQAASVARSNGVGA